jgi:prepilin-type N-terminal cleavage/methylation domain-containing protein
MKPTGQTHKRGFTIIELLVVIAIISLLVGLLTPGISMMTKSARTLKQKSIFHGYETGLELFRKDFDYYPPSALETNAFGDTGKYVTGAQHLAEALMGRDLEGFDPKSRWCDETEPTGPTGAYGPGSINRRKEPYVVVKDDGICSLAELYNVAGGGDIGRIFSPAPVPGSPDDTRRRAPVMTDIFGRRKITLVTGEQMKMGTPVLYFRADTTTKRFMGSDPITSYNRWIYNYDDNAELLALGTVNDPAVKHKFEPSQQTIVNGRTYNGIEYFYETIRNPQFRTLNASGQPQSDKPYNPNTFILMSAGWDGIFGTKDDVTNFDY